ncbi:MAG: glycine cleavage system aminomethyltransferase GcvT [Pseudomonadota bacterium]
MQKTPLYQKHLDDGGKIVEFGGWQLPVHYGSLVDEHHAVRQSVGMFDVSHMTIVDIEGADATSWLRQLLCNDVATLTRPGAALYSCMLNDGGGIIDDLIVYRFDEQHYRMVVNAATRDKDLAWLALSAKGLKVQLTEKDDLAMVAVQGPDAVAVANNAMSQAISLNRFESCMQQDWFIAATGYTGEHGYEIALPAAEASGFWDALLAAGAKPCGLGARDTLRLEAGMNLYGTDMTESDTPLTSGLGWTVAWQPQDRDFTGRAALNEQRKNGIPYEMTGYVLEGKGVLRSGQLLFNGDEQIGVITSGTFSPTLNRSIAFARVNSDAVGDCEVQIRRNRLPVSRVSRVFVRDGKSVISATD